MSHVPKGFPPPSSNLCLFPKDHPKSLRGARRPSSPPEFCDHQCGHQRPGEGQAMDPGPCNDGKAKYMVPICPMIVPVLTIVWVPIKHHGIIIFHYHYHGFEVGVLGQCLRGNEVLVWIHNMLVKLTEHGFWLKTRNVCCQPKRSRSFTKHPSEQFPISAFNFEVFRYIYIELYIELSTWVWHSLT